MKNYNLSKSMAINIRSAYQELTLSGEIDKETAINFICLIWYLKPRQVEDIINSNILTFNTGIEEFDRMANLYIKKTYKL